MPTSKGPAYRLERAGVQTGIPAVTGFAAERAGLLRPLLFSKTDRPVDYLRPVGLRREVLLRRRIWEPLCDPIPSGEERKRWAADSSKLRKSRFVRFKDLEIIPAIDLKGGKCVRL